MLKGGVEDLDDLSPVMMIRATTRINIEKNFAIERWHPLLTADDEEIFKCLYIGVSWMGLPKLRVRENSFRSSNHF